MIQNQSAEHRDGFLGHNKVFLLFVTVCFVFFEQGSTLVFPSSASKRWCRDLYNASVQVQNFDWGKHLKHAKCSRCPMEKHLNCLNNSQVFNGVLIWHYVDLTINIIHTAQNELKMGTALLTDPLSQA